MKFVVVLITVLGFLLAACGDPETNPPQIEPPAISVREYLTEASKLGNSFAAAVLQTGVLAELEPDTVYTMFLPPSAWFEERGITKETLLAHPQLEEIVAYHFL